MRRSQATLPLTHATVGARVLQARQERGFTQKELAGETLTASYISHIESGKSRPSLKTLATLANRLGYPMSHFIAGEEAVALVGATIPPTVITASIERAMLHLLSGDAQEARASLLIINPATHDTVLEAWYFYTLGLSLSAVREWDAARVALERAYTGSKIIAPALAARCLITNAQNALDAQQISRAQSLVQLLDLAGVADLDPLAWVEGVATTAQVAYAAHTPYTPDPAADLARALNPFEIARATCESRYASVGALHMLLLLAHATRRAAAYFVLMTERATTADDTDAAGVHAAEAARISRTVGDMAGEIAAMRALTELHLRQGATDAAIEVFTQMTHRSVGANRSCGAGERRPRRRANLRPNPSTRTCRSCLSGGHRACPIPAYRGTSSRFCPL